MAIRTLMAAMGVAALLAIPAQADFDTALRAYESGDHSTALSEWTTLANGGDAIAQWLVGNMYLNGEGVPAPNPSGAAVFYTRAAEQGYAEAQVSLGTLYRLGLGVDQDYRVALAWLYEAAAKKHPLAQMDLGDLFLDGVPGEVQADPSHALEWYRLAAKQGVILGQFKAAQLYIEGIGSDPDPERGLAWMAIAARAVDGKLESALSKRVMPADKIVDSDPARRTLAELLKATYSDYKRRLPADVVARAEARAVSYTPENF